ncbi:alpha/beta fold hydrolase [Thermobacillus sp. ZCTH02-B1]|uniref:alpha/beta hydrolase n=1 Tax=Thermobacillus sp. ZCTH02-B1 TaxID=1858795 RepID=UPI0025F404A8|nr:alpha/beta fold hydrolase [Thermobacillus sp. ZCTH02-B1]
MWGWAVGAAAVIAAAGGGAYAVSAKMQQPKRRPIEAVPQAPYETVRFESEGVPMAGWLIRPPSAGADAAAPRPTVVVAHGWGSNRSRVLRYAHPLVNAGYNVFVYDARCHGESGSIKAPTGLMFKADIRAAVETAAKLPGVDASRIAVLGHSMGGLGALLACADGLGVRAVVTDNAPLTLETIIRSELRRRKLPAFPLDRIMPRVWLFRAGIPYSAVAGIDMPAWVMANAKAVREGRGTPVLMIHATGDPIVPADELRRVAARAPVEHRFVEVDGHSSSERDPAFWETVLPFLERHLGGGGSPRTTDDGVIGA